MRPGITGWTQLVFAHESELLDGPDPVQRYIDDLLPTKVMIDQAYVQSYGWLNDLKVMLLTPLVALLSLNVVPNWERRTIQGSRPDRTVLRPQAAPRWNPSRSG